MQTDWHALSRQDLLKALETSQAGLALDTIAARQKQYGQNTLPRKEEDPVLKVVLRQFTSPLMIILLLAAVASVAIGHSGDMVVILLAALVNGVVGFIQEWKASKAAKALKSYEIPHARVRRGGAVQDVAATELVPGDWVLLEAGSRIPADVRLVELADFHVDEALLTGESFPVEKESSAVDKARGVSDRTNMAFFGTMAVRGRAEGVVTSIGLKTQLGQIAQLVSDTRDDQTPLQRQMKRFSWLLGAILVVVASVMFVVGLLQGIALKEMVSISIALAVASIPEGLVVALTVVLAVGMQRMLKRKALVRRLVAAETLGSVSVVCTDKTGTLTQGSMSVTRIATLDQPQIDRTSDDAHEALCIGALNNDAEYSVEEACGVGHPTEVALVEAAAQAGIDVADIRGTWKRVDEIPFSSDLKYMATLHAQNGEKRLLVKGAPERVFAMCEMTKDERARFEALSKDMAADGLRVLAVAKKDGAMGVDQAELNGLTCVGLLGLQDPLRPTTVDTIKELKGAGVHIVLITGDHPKTARSIATAAGLSVLESGVVIGEEISAMSDADLRRRIGSTTVFARVNPSHKVRIVEAWKHQGDVVAMIGDGVNDAAAMKAADIGVALGSGTDVAHETSDMVLLNDDLSSITAAVREGRVVFDNIRKVTVNLVVDSFSEIVLIGGAIAFGLPLPILAAQVLWINLVTDGFPSIAMTMEPAESDVMKRKPRPKSEPVVNGQMKFLIFFIGILTDIGLFGLFLFLRGVGYDLAHLRTVIFTALAVDSLIYVYAIRSLRRSVFSIHPFGNHWLNWAVIAGLIMQGLAVYAPFMQSLFETVPLGVTDLLIVLGLAGLKFIAIEITKELFFIRQLHRKFLPSRS